MFTGRIRIRVPGILAAERQRHALVGLDRQHQLVGPHAERAVLAEARGAGRACSVTAISVTLRARRLPVRR